MQDLERLVSNAQALIFDCDGTLVETPGLYAAAWQEAFKAEGHEMAAEWYHERAGMSEHVLLDAFEQEMGVSLDHESIVRNMRSAVFRNVDQIREIGSVSSIARQQKGHRPMAVASGGPAPIVLSSLRVTGLLPLFDAVITMDDVERAKPAPDLFLEAASRLDVDPAKCLVFEDSPQGLLAARNAEMQVIDVNDLIHADSHSVGA